MSPARRPTKGRFDRYSSPSTSGFTGFEDKVVGMYARGMTAREIQGFLPEQHGTEVSPEFINTITDAAMANVTT